MMMKNARTITFLLVVGLLTVAGHTAGVYFLCPCLPKGKGGVGAVSNHLFLFSYSLSILKPKSPSFLLLHMQQHLLNNSSKEKKKKSCHLLLLLPIAPTTPLLLFLPTLNSATITAMRTRTSRQQQDIHWSLSPALLLLLLLLLVQRHLLLPGRLPFCLHVVHS